MKTKGQVELSVGTIVIIVLAMVMLIGGVMLVRNIFSGSTDAITTVSDQISNEINKMFGEDKKVVVYPSSDTIKVGQDKIEGFAIGIRNKLTGAQSQNAQFSYDVVAVSDVQEDCGVSLAEINNLFSAGSNSDTGIPIATGDPKAIVVLFDTGEGDPLCTVRFRIDVKANSQNYDYAYVFVEFTD